ncbi:MAG: hypothetical protein WCW33_00095 [Candidatus Babeliales bacterium]|jgi:hypothetical protein
MSLFFACFIFLRTDARILLFAIHHNRPDFLELQYKCLKKFLAEKNDFDFIVVSDATDKKCKQQIESICKKFNIRCVNFPQELHLAGVLIDKMKQLGCDHLLNSSHGSVRHCQLVRFALENFGLDSNDIVGIMEGDIFLIRAFSIREYLYNHDLIGTLQSDRRDNGLTYIWIGLSFFNLNKLPNPKTFNFDLTFVNEAFLDSGGSTYWYLKDNPYARVKTYKRVPLSALPREDGGKLRKLGFSQKEISFLEKTLSCPACNHEFSYLAVEFHIDNHFLHYAMGRKSTDSDAKSILFKKFLSDILT